MHTVYRKSAHHGHTFETRAPLNGLQDNEGAPYYFKISTYKNSRGVQSFASVIAVGDQFERSALFQDFAKWIKPAQAVTRATEKSVKAVHDETLKQWDSLFAEALAHHTPKAA